MSSYKYCFVPQCVNTSKRNPEKVFFNVPKHPETRSKWCRIARRQELSNQTSRFCCEDHFDLEEDVKNWAQYKIMQNAGLPPFRLRLKEGVLPTIFDCQENPKRAHSTPFRRSVVKKLESREAVFQALEEGTSNTCIVPQFVVQNDSTETIKTSVSTSPSCSDFNASDGCIVNLQRLQPDTTDNTTVSESFLPSIYASETSSHSEVNADVESPTILNHNISLRSPCGLDLLSTTAVFHKPLGVPSTLLDHVQSTSLNSRSVLNHHYTTFPLQTSYVLITNGVQGTKVDFEVQVTPSYATVGTQTDWEVESDTQLYPELDVPFNQLNLDSSDTEEDCTPMEVKTSIVDDDESPNYEPSFCLNSSAYHVSSYSTIECDEDEAYRQESLKKQFVELNIQLMECKCKHYLGLDPHNMFLIEKLQNFAQGSKKQIMIVLRKVKLNEPNNILGDIFGVSEATVSRAIAKYLPEVSGFLENFIDWPSEDIIYSNLPIPFQINYSDVQSIISCFEVEIEKPSNALHQVLTWSDYKKCNTLKYLISSTPDGLINFISKGFGGRATDVQIVKKSQYLDKLRPNMVVMADGGFMHVESILKDKQCFIVRPSSVRESQKMTEEEIRKNKVVASLRILIERVINRVRENTFLSAHSRFHHSMINVIDHVVTIACGLSNMQGPFSKSELSSPL